MLAETQVFLGVFFALFEFGIFGFNNYAPLWSVMGFFHISYYSEIWNQYCRICMRPIEDKPIYKMNIFSQ